MHHYAGAVSSICAAMCHCCWCSTPDFGSSAIVCALGGVPIHSVRHVDLRHLCMQGCWSQTDGQWWQGRAGEAIACYEHVALLQPESAEAHANLASCYKDAARQDAAITSYRRALAMRPDFPEAFANLVHSLQCVCEWRDRPSLFQRMEVEVPYQIPLDTTALLSVNTPAVHNFHLNTLHRRLRVGTSPRQ